MAATLLVVGLAIVFAERDLARCCPISSLCVPSGHDIDRWDVEMKGGDLAEHIVDSVFSG